MLYTAFSLVVEGIQILDALFWKDWFIAWDMINQFSFHLLYNLHACNLKLLFHVWFPRTKDGRTLAVASTDGYCSFVTFEPGELGTPYVSQPLPTKTSTTTPAPPSTSTTTGKTTPIPAAPVKSPVHQSANQSGMSKTPEGVSKGGEEKAGVSSAPIGSVSTAPKPAVSQGATVNGAKEPRRIVTTMISPPGWVTQGHLKSHGRDVRLRPYVAD